MGSQKGKSLVKTDLAKVAEARADFLKRFFAVAVSVGFASKIATLDFLLLGTPPSLIQTESCALLIFAMFVVVGSWDFYFSSLIEKPLVDWARFALDIAIVTIYIILLQATSNIRTFSLYLSIIMICYLVWDIFSIRMYPKYYGIDRLSLANVAKLISHGLARWTERKTPIYNTGLFITFWWTPIFFLISFQVRTGNFEFFWSLMSAFLAYVAYRRDQYYSWGLIRRLVFTTTCLVILYGSAPAETGIEAAFRSATGYAFR